MLALENPNFSIRHFCSDVDAMLQIPTATVDANTNNATRIAVPTDQFRSSCKKITEKSFKRVPREIGIVKWQQSWFWCDWWRHHFTESHTTRVKIRNPRGAVPLVHLIKYLWQQFEIGRGPDFFARILDRFSTSSRVAAVQQFFCMLLSVDVTAYVSAGHSGSPRSPQIIRSTSIRPRGWSRP
jgi:hypothetical protein